MNLTRIRPVGLESVQLATTLLQRARLADPEIGMWDAADIQWWWRRPRESDAIQQSFWVDAKGPVGCTLLTEFGSFWQLDLIALPDHAAELRPIAWEDALLRASQLGLKDLEVLARDDDELMLRLLSEAGFTAGDSSGGTTWMSASEAPSPRALPADYEFTDRSIDSGSHWLASRNSPDVGTRLSQCSLYDPQLDMAVKAVSGETAAYALFWFDPVTSVGMIEPLRTEEAHRRLGLARVLIREGVARLVDRGAKRLKVGYAAAAAKALYLETGFESSSTDHAYRLRWT